MLGEGAAQICLNNSSIKQASIPTGVHNAVNARSLPYHTNLRLPLQQIAEASQGESHPWLHLSTDPVADEATRPSEQMPAASRTRI